MDLKEILLGTVYGLLSKGFLKSDGYKTIIIIILFKLSFALRPL